MFREKSEFYSHGKKIYSRTQKRSEKEKDLNSRIALIKNALHFAKYSKVPHAEERIQELEEKLNDFTRKKESEMRRYPKTHKEMHTYKKMKPERIESLVREKVYQAKAADESYVTAEDIARDLNIKVHFVTQVFMKLNQEGVLSQARHNIPHDSSRDPINGGSSSMWVSNIYYFIDKGENDENV